MPSTKKLLILMVEDRPARVSLVKTWLPEDMRVVQAPSAGTAIGMLRLDRGRVYAGVMLDHDLNASQRGGIDDTLTGRDVADAVVEYVDRAVPVLVHSMSIEGNRWISERLRRAGYSVTTAPMDTLTRETFTAWIGEVREAAAEE
jgi:CheY-like chemotaxis protein